MSKIWTERFDPRRHRNPMNWGWDAPEAPAIERHHNAPTLERHDVWFVRVAGFTFEFHALPQLRACLAYYATAHHPTSRLPVANGTYGGDQSETQRWFERLPMYLLEAPKREQVVKALTNALTQWESESR
jgi:hypothetical protein